MSHMSQVEIEKSTVASVKLQKKKKCAEYKFQHICVFAEMNVANINSGDCICASDHELWPGKNQMILHNVEKVALCLRVLSQK